MGVQEVTLTFGLAPAHEIAKRELKTTLTARQSLKWRQLFEWLKEQGATYRRWDGREMRVVVPGDVIRWMCDRMEEES